jgi:excisionase family DNA binding protein
VTARLDAALTELADAIREEVRAELASERGAPDRLLDVASAAEAAGVGRSLLYSMIADGRVRSVKLGRRRVVPASAIAELAQAPPGASR